MTEPIKELFSVSIAPLVTKSFAVRWTQDNHISVITKKGVHVFELIPTPTQPWPVAKFYRTFVYPPENMPAMEFVSVVEGALWKMKKEEVYSLLMDEALTPCIPSISDSTPFITTTEWSPSGLMHPNGILLDMQHIQLGTFSISGLTVTGKDQAYITTQDGALISLYIQNTKITTKRINHSTSQAQLQQYLGLSCSPNKILFVNVTSPNSMYDHLVIREPSKVSLFTLEAKEFDPVSLLYENPSRTLKNHWDCLETIRLTAAKSENFSKVFPKVPTNLESLPLYELRIAMWISTMLDICKKKDLLKRSQIVVEISEAQPLVFIHCAIDILERLKKKTSLSKDNKICIRLLRSYLEVYLAGEEDDEDTNLTQLVKETLKDTAHMSTPENELCTLCGEVISDLSWNVTRCPSGHQIPRCARSLLQISSVQYRSCPFCGLLLHPWLDEEYEEPLCPYCQVPALYDGRVLSVSDTNGIPFLNLSERRRTIQPPGKTQGSENVSKGHLRRPRTFAVVVNNEEDDACNITETWQEF
ncbi:uncharacterized protein LOC107266451 isoform X4 [Cephus cinctus]|uniref:Uncharacterized protein LOC107266451 isoform X4 n=1 Tax=Cephus cinctus TaxID=211228 RepID=A0AAJ7VZZ1_CEPCN|nr:uncharacterized protein LOC107266451 isoform X4 [Cephus cinctus]